MRHFHRVALLAAATALSTPVLAAAPKSVPIPTLVSQVSIPHSMFKLKNGLTVIVHEDHKAPVISSQRLVQCRVEGRARRARPASRTCSSI